MYKPQFPYTGNQVIITSGRVVNHSYDDFIFLFGKKGVSISSPATFTVDANEKTIIGSPIIELGLQAQTTGEPVFLAKTTAVQLGFLIDAIINVSDALNKLAAEETESSIPLIIQTTKVLSDTAKNVKARLGTECISKTTFTK